jgi:hypothetical protein
MRGFGLMIDALFRNPVLGVDALFRPGGTGDPVPVRVVLRRPDRIASFGDGRFVAEAILIDVRIAEVAALAPGDRFELGAVTYEVRGEPVRDSERLVWAAEARAL